MTDSQYATSSYFKLVLPFVMTSASSFVPVINASTYLYVVSFSCAMPLGVLSMGRCVVQMRLKEMGVLQPTDVQREAIPKALTGTNVAIQCYTGSGKVCAYNLAPTQEPGCHMCLAEALLISFRHTSLEQVLVTQTLAYLLPVLTLALQKAEAEFEELAKVGKAHTAGNSAILLRSNSSWADASSSAVTKGCCCGSLPKEEAMRSQSFSVAGTLQAIVVAPSRELAMQIMRVGQAILPNEAKGCVQQAIGGANPRRQVGKSMHALS